MASNNTQSLIEAAEENFKSHNPKEALRLAMMAKQLSPLFDGILDRFIAAYGVHLASASKNSNGDINLYAVLGITDALADNETIKKNYKKLALLVHPDKNTSVAAEGAFKLISEAWNVLSQPTWRKAYDDRCCPRSTPGGRPCPNWYRVPVVPGLSTVTPAVCPLCGAHFFYRCAEFFSIKCQNCRFGMSASLQGLYSVGFGNREEAYPFEFEFWRRDS